MKELFQCQTWIYVPAKERMAGKIQTLTADGYIVDLEDSIANEKKKKHIK